MHDPLQRLYRTKLALLATLLMFVGLGLLIFAEWTAHLPSWRWLMNWPIGDVGSGLFTTGLLGVALQYFDGQDSEVRATHRLERVLTASAPAMRDAVIDGFAFEPTDLARVATPETLDKIAINALAIRLGDTSFADEIYADLRAQAINRAERLRDARVSIRLSVDQDPPKDRAPMFVTTVRWESTLVPIHQTRRFACLSDLDEFRELRQDTTATSAWFIRQQPGVDAGERTSFELVDFTVDGKRRPIRRTTKQGGQTYSVSLAAETIRAAKPVTVAYTYRTLTSVDGSFLQLRVDQPTKGLAVEFDYGESVLDRVNVLDFIASSHAAQIARSSPALPERIITVDFDGWVFPRSGVVFAWALRPPTSLPANRS